MSKGTKERIIKGAGKLFYKHGYAGVRVDDIAEFIGITKKTIYNHFPNKLAVIQAVIEMNVQNVCDRLDDITSDENGRVGAIDKIHRLILFGFHEIDSNSWLFTVDKKNKHARDLIEDSLELIRMKIIEMAGEYLEKGIKEGMFRPDVSNEILPYLVTIIVEGIFQLKKYPRIQVKGDELFKESMKMIYEGILTSKGKKAFRERL